ncbi:ABC transporter permease [Sandaracinomonas limnophila]|uniref:ABC transporter permease n=1 Tax=Sandaracinomonas limnophila TaxID=1862386 RepID=A0A437PXH5_9BACT|nr:FtsX-like permease family protein [Sandaracinomonas limnophila]RVU26957.1 ABC transporter permease [Sandaracinomonas limnophila]
MNFSLFVAKKIRHTEQASFSRTVTYVGIGTIGLGVSIILISFAILFGFKQAIIDKISGFYGDYKISKVSENHSQSASFIQVPPNWESSILQNQEIKFLHKIVQTPGLVVGKKSLSGIIIKGTQSKEFLSTILPQHLLGGRSKFLTKSSIIISKTIAEKCQVKVGDKLILYYLQAANRPRKVTVQAIFETGLEEIDQYTVFCDIGWVKEMIQVPANLYTSVEVHTKEHQTDIYQKLEKSLPETVKVESIQELDPAIFDWLGMLDRNIVILITLLLVVAGFNIIATLWVLIMERIPMIGLLKSMGASNTQIRRIFWWNGMFILIWGLIIGNLFALVFCYLQGEYHLIPLDPSTYYMNSVPIAWSSQSWLLTNIGTIALVAVFLSIPTLYIQKISPLEAIRFRE